MARKLQVEIVGDASSLQKAFRQAGSASSGFGSKLGSVAKYAGLAVGGAALGGLAVVLKQGAAEFAQAAKVSAQTGAVLKSTGQAANVTAKEINDLAGSLMRKSGVDDEAIQSGENMLLTFTKIRNEAGAGNDVFNQATKATLDLSVAMGKDMTSSAILVGKALNDPLKGMTALNKAGIQFTADQKKTIASLVESGHTMEAQKLILGELTTQFGGSAEALGKTLPGQVNILRESFNNLAGDIVSGLAPSFAKGVAAASDFVSKLSAAKSVHAKLVVVWEGISDITASITAALSKAWSGTDVGTIMTHNTSGAGMNEGIKGMLKKVDWAKVGAGVASDMVSSISKAIAKVSWGQVLAAILKGFDSIHTALAQAFLGAAYSLGIAIEHGVMKGLSGLGSSVGKKLGEVVSAVAKLPGKILAAVGSLGSLLIKAGASLIGGLISGIKSMFDPVKKTLGDLTHKLTSWKGPEGVDRMLLYGSGRLVMGGFQRGLESKYGDIHKSLYTFTGLIAADARRAVEEVITTAESAWSKAKVVIATGGSGLPMKPTQYVGADGHPISDSYVEEQIQKSLDANPNASTGGSVGVDFSSIPTDAAGWAALLAKSPMSSYVKMAAGGMGTVTKPTLFMAGEAGREDYAFSGANKAFGGGGQVVNFHFPQYIGARDELISWIRDGLTRAGRRDPNIFGGVA